jgi:hypothetical protein
MKLNIDLNFFIVLLIVLISGNPAMSLVGEELVYILTLLILGCFWLVQPKKFSQSSVIFVASFIGIFILQIIIHGSIVVIASIGYTVKIIIAMLVVRLVPDFFSKYIAVMYFLAALSLLFYVPTLLGIDLRSMFSSLNLFGGSNIVHIGLHNFQRSFEVRNCGVFWEPGAFAGYLVLAIFFSVIFKESLQSKWTLRILILALVTTQSTAGLLTGFIVFLVYAYSKVKAEKPNKFGFMLIPVLLMAGLVGYFSFGYFDFLGDKINGQLMATSDEAGDFQINRFGNFLFDLNYIYDSPLLGWGANPETRFSTDSELADLITGQGVGLTGFIVKFGLLSFFIFYFYVYRAFCSITESKLFGISILIIISVLLMGEQYLNFPLFYTLAFVDRFNNNGEHKSNNRLIVR